ncbi:MAG: hypothetical protein HMLKMBBP_01048 [Planctomycetes bacterium]|nr:hypothetical protein [Planctomycetota bacterium]
MRTRPLLVVAGAAGLALGAAAFLCTSGGDAPVRPAPGGPALAEPRSPDRAALPLDPAAPPGGSATAASAPDPRLALPRIVTGRQVLFGTDARPMPEAAGGDLGAAARALLDRHRPLFARMPGELRLVREHTTLSAHHVRFVQVIGGVPVEGSEIAAHVARDGRPLLVHVEAFAAGGAAAEPVVSAAEAAAAAIAHMTDTGAEDEPVEAESNPPVLVILPEGRAGRLAWRVDVRTDAQSSSVWVDAQEAGAGILAQRELRRAADGIGDVYDPNPIHSARNPAFRDLRDRSGPELEAELRTVTIPRLDGTGSIRGQWADGSGTLGAGVTPTLDWRGITRDQRQFEVLNAYFHIDRTQDRIRALGILDANGEMQRFDAHGLAADQSYYDPFGDRIALGDGGVDDAEDADIVIHEYGHAIQDDQVPGYGATFEGASMGEGFADFLCCAMHASGDDTYDPLVAAWDASSYSNAPIPFLRRVDTNKKYPRDIEHEVHADGEIWSAFCWDLRALIGHDDALRVVIESHTFLASNAQFRHGANAVLVANVALRGGADDDGIRALLRERGLPFTQPPADAPPEDAFEENDFQPAAAALPAGDHPDLLLADDDWYVVTAPPYRTLVATATFDGIDVPLDLELRRTGGAVIATSAGDGDSESVRATAGADAATWLLRATRTGGSDAVAGYRLVLSEGAPDEVGIGQQALRSASAGSDAVRVSVPQEKVDAGTKLSVVCRTRGSAYGINDVRVVSPSGATAADFGEGRRKWGAKVAVDATEPGEWIVEVRPRFGPPSDGKGKYAIRTTFR